MKFSLKYSIFNEADFKHYNNKLAKKYNKVRAGKQAVFFN